VTLSYPAALAAMADSKFMQRPPSNQDLSRQIWAPIQIDSEKPPFDMLAFRMRLAGATTFEFTVLSVFPGLLALWYFCACGDNTLDIFIGAKNGVTWNYNVGYYTTLGKLIHVMHLNGHAELNKN